MDGDEFDANEVNIGQSNYRSLEGVPRLFTDVRVDKTASKKRHNQSTNPLDFIRLTTPSSDILIYGTKLRRGKTQVIYIKGCKRGVL